MATVAEHIRLGRYRQAHAILKAQRRPTPHAAAQLLELDTFFKRAERLIGHMDEPTFWGKPKGRHGAFSIWHRLGERGLHLFKATVTFDVSPVDLLVICREWDLLPSWNGASRRSLPRGRMPCHAVACRRTASVPIYVSVRCSTLTACPRRAPTSRPCPGRESRAAGHHHLRAIADVDARCGRVVAAITVQQPRSCLRGVR
jgi:hypothetical protein